MRANILIVCVMLSGCASKQVFVVPPPQTGITYVKSYDIYPTFHGVEVIVGFPGLKGIPVIGPLLGELIQIRAGTNQDVVVPIMEPVCKPAGAMGAPPTKKAVDESRSRWSSYNKR